MESRKADHAAWSADFQSASFRRTNRAMSGNIRLRARRTGSARSRLRRINIRTFPIE